MHISDLLQNHLLINSLIAWAVAQILKTIIYACAHKELDWERLFGDGGMPSGHSATVTAVCVMSAFFYGLASFQFAVSGILAIIVCHDAMGVRQQAGKQAVLLNELIKSFETLTSNALPEVKLKEFVGHTPIQVIAGILIGAVDAALLYWLVY